LIEQAPAQFLERDHDVIAKRGAVVFKPQLADQPYDLLDID
jgi:hypothetical protein